jgi:uncharacterized protein (TIGR03437 family)
MPAGLALGRAMITVLRDSSPVASGTVQVASTAPAVFSANAAGHGIAAAHITRVKGDGALIHEPVSQFDSAQGGPVAKPIGFGDPGDRLFLALYGTGIRGSSASVGIAGLELTPSYAGPQHQFPGLDQVNVELPRSLEGAGTVEVVLSLDGVQANAVTLLFQ